LLKSPLSEQSFSLRRNFSWTLVGNVFYSACQGGMLIVLAKLGTPEMLGAFTFALAVTAPLFMFSNLQLRVVQATDAKAQFTFSDYLGLRLASTLLALSGLILFTLLFPSEHSTVVLMIGIAKAIESISDMCYGFMQQQERMDFISISLMIKGTLSLLLLAMGIVATGQVLGGAAGLTVAWTIVLLGYDFRVIRRLNKNGRQGFSGVFPTWKGSIQQKLIRLTLPLGFVMLLISLNSNIPQYLIQYFIVKNVLSPRELGIFAAIAYLMLVGSILQGALAQAASPRLAKYYADGRRRAFSSLLFNLMGLGVMIGGMGVGVSWLWGKQFLTILYQSEYAQYSNLLVWLMLAAAFEYICSFLGTGITAAQYFRVQVPLFATSAVVMAIACFILIPIQGLAGIPTAMMTTGVLRIVLSFAILAHALNKLKSPDLPPQVFL
jgi:O-antigen/teichoic acid export membrane protein